MDQAQSDWSTARAVQQEWRLWEVEVFLMIRYVYESDEQ